MKNKIVILGAGRIGKAIGKMIGDVQYVDKGDSYDKADIIFLCVPSWVVPEIKLPKDSIIISLTKGLVNGKSMAQYLQGYNFSILGGPMMAEEKGKVGVMAPYRDIGIKDLKIIKSDNPHSVAMAGVLKNIYALAVCQGKSDNQKGYLISQAIKEILIICERLNLDKDILLGPAGLGDLVASAFSPFSRHRKVAEGKKQISEGRESLPQLIKLLNNNLQDLSLLNNL